MDLSLSDILPDISLFKKSKTKNKNISSVEAFQIWNLLRVRYISLETYQFYLNFVHDRDFEILFREQMDDFRKQINNLEELAQKYSVKSPNQPPKEIKFSHQVDAITDKFIYRKLHEDLIAELYLMSRGIIDSTLNDDVRETLIDYTLNHVENYSALYKLGKLKGWTEVAPAYQSGKEVKEEGLSTSESSQLLEHINFRYDQLHLTKCFMDIVHDKEFNQLLKRGQGLLKEQLQTLENKAIKYELPLPERPPSSSSIKIDPETLEDEFIYRTILKGMQDSIHIHMRGVIETLRNDDLRDIYDKFMRQEMKGYHNYVKYGNLKGWTQVRTIYGGC